MKWYLKLWTIYVLRFFMRVLYIFPIKQNRILFSAISGNAYKCNPKYIFEDLYKNLGPECEYIWVIRNKNLIPEGYSIQTVKPLSPMHLYYLMTSKVIIANVGIEPFVPPRKGRIFINTWHGGGAYKKGGLSASYYSKAHKYYFKKVRDLRAKSTTYLLSTNRRFSEIFQKDFKLRPDQILPIGMPRNDIFFAPAATQKEVRQKVCQKLGLPADAFIILYAPTYRGHEENCEHIDWTIDTEAVQKSAKKRFGKDAVVLYRCHLNVYNDRQDIKGAYDASDYPDMQELLAATDLLISDYSSLIWDFSMTKRPGYLYTPDLDRYVEVTQLHTPIEQWQYPYSKNMTELCQQIENYDEKAAVAKIEDHHNLLGNVEDGTATRKIRELISDAISGNTYHKTTIS